jgi:hypothetical protein
VRPAGARARRWWCNADFDLTLAHSGGKLPGAILAAAREMAWHFWPALAETDTLIVPAPPPDSFLKYISACGLRPPRFSTGPEEDDSGEADSLFTPFGWNAEAHRRNARHSRPAAAPDAEAVKRVNSRAFSAVLERENFPEFACPATFCPNAADLRHWLNTALPGRYVAKGNHGQAGIGQIRFEIPENGSKSGQNAPVPGYFRALSRLCQRMDGVVLEKEQNILAEFGVLFRLHKTGNISTIRVHHLLSEMNGKYSGACVAPEGVPNLILDPWLKNIEESVTRIARALCKEGYFGPVGVDMYVHESEGSARFRAITDINARCSMAWPVHGLAQCFQGRAVMVCPVSAEKIFPSLDCDDMTIVTNNLFFDTKTRRGSILLTPPRASKRHSLAFVGNDVADVMSLRKTTLELLALKGKL